MEQACCWNICGGENHLSRLVLTGSILLPFGALLLLRSDWLFSLKAGWFSGKSLLPAWDWHFFTLQSVGYCIDVFRGKIHGVKNWRQLGLYLLIYPRLIWDRSCPTALR